MSKKYKQHTAAPKGAAVATIEVQEVPAEPQGAVSCEETPSGAPTTPKSNASGKSSPIRALLKKLRHSARRHIAHIAGGSVFGVVCLALLILLGTMVYAMRSQQSEVGREIYHSATEVAFCEVLTDLDSIDTSVLGEHTVKLRFFDFLELDSTLSVVDTVAPTVTVHELYATKGAPIAPEDFIVGANDKTALSYSFVQNEAGESVIRVTDEGGNFTDTAYTVIYTDEIDIEGFEAGTDESEVLVRLDEYKGIDLPDVTGANFEVCGSYKAKCKYNGTDCVFLINVVDTIAPTAAVHSKDIALGQTIRAIEFLSDISDISPTKAHFESEPAFDTPGAYDVGIVLEDASGNTTTYSAKLNVHDMPCAVVMEAGTPSDIFREQLRALINTDTVFPQVSDSMETQALPVGSHKIELIGQYGPIKIDVDVKDTEPPVLALREMSVLVGKAPRIMDFIVDCSDASAFNLSFESAPNSAELGSYTVAIVATDSFGNTSRTETIMRVVKDSTPPTIYGVKNITVYEGESISYRSGVYAQDLTDGKVTVSVDTSRVNASVAGTYTVTYTATDSDGNVAKQNATVTVRAVSASIVNALADDVLETIITPSMGVREKARAIYDWCRRNILYSTSTSHLMGYFNKAAYSGFTRHYGNCYTYYAVASALLTRVGIQNIEIRRNSTTNPHYWNLVSVDGAWYHLDTCPQPPPHSLEVFLLTDSAVRAFPLSYYYDFNRANYPATP